MSSNKIVNYYQEYYDEQSRLLREKSKIEFERAKEIIQRYLPSPPVKILDVGGGTGIYSSWLAKLGYDVHLIDIVPLHINQAKATSAKQPRHPFKVSLGDARKLSEKDKTYDVVLLFGPLYHLINKKERLLALSEARRVLRKNGLLFVVAISRFASLLDGLRSKWLNDPEFKKIVERDLKNGKHLSKNPKYFTTAFFHYPDELIKEIKKSSFVFKELFALEGPVWLLSDLAERWKNKKSREQLLYVVRAIEQEPSLIGISAHLLAVAYKK